jgi:4-amino-4-deoxy-L-arabinose transferase-like glycosyltransferase
MVATSEPALAPAAPPASASTPTGRALLLVLITLAGAYLRLLHLGSKSLWQDEPATVALARMLWPQFLRVWWHGEASYQAAYFLLMRGWVHLGQSETFLRFPAALFGIASIPVIYVVARKLLGDEAALASAAILAFSPTHVYYSQEARSYTMAILLVLLSSWFFVRAVQQNRESDWAWWTIFSVLAVFTHLFASFVLVGQACSLFAHKEPSPWKRMIAHALLILGMTAPGMTRAPIYAWMPQATPKELLHLALFLGGSGEKLALSALLWIAAVRLIFRDRVRDAAGDMFWRGMFLVSWAVVPILLNGLLSIYHPVFVQRYMIFCLPATIMLAGLGMMALPRWHLGLWLVVALCATSIINVFVGYRKPREDWRNATRAILASAQPGDAVVVYPSYARPGFDYYYERSPRAPGLRVFTPPFYGVGEDDQALLRVLNSSPGEFRHVWVMVRQEGPGRQDLPGYSPEVAAKLHSVFREPEQRQFNGITLLEFGH